MDRAEAWRGDADVHTVNAHTAIRTLIVDRTRNTGADGFIVTTTESQHQPPDRFNGRATRYTREGRYSTCGSTSFYTCSMHTLL